MLKLLTLNEWGDYIYLRNQMTEYYRNISLEEFTNKFNQINKDNSFIFLYYRHEGDKPIGCIQITVETKLYDSIARLDDVLIDNKYTNNGYGKKMMIEAIEFIKYTYQNTVYKITVSSRAGVEGFYEKLGLKETGTEMSMLI
jgi:predicted GNAT family N-acyltransferase